VKAHHVTSTSVRRHKATGVLVLLGALLATGLGYTAVTAAAEASAPSTAASATLLEEGRQLYLEGCATCHGLGAQGIDDGQSYGPSLIGVGAAAVDFQVATGRMPLAAPINQAPRKPPVYTPEEIAALAAYIASLGPGPAIPTEEQYDASDADLAEGGELFRTNCAQCHNAAGKGGALSEGRYAPSLMDATPKEIYEAMLTGPQNMPNFPDSTIPEEEKQAIIAFIENLQTGDSPGGFALGALGPVTEGVFIWTAGLGLLLAAAVWIGAKVR
jgi:ubiquinol-cytochrome c reductase cytochrome c subunit